MLNQTRILAVAALLALAALAAPSTAQVTPPSGPACFAALQDFPDTDPAACEPTLDPTPPTPADCALDADPTDCSLPSIGGCDTPAEYVGCLLEATGLFACDDLTDASTCTLLADPTGDAGAAVCQALDDTSEETDAAACVSAAIEAAAGDASDTVLGTLSGVTGVLDTILAVDVDLTAPAGTFVRGQAITMSATASSLISAIPLVSLECTLTLVSQPTGSVAVAPAVTDCANDVVIAPFTADKVGTYVFNLTVNHAAPLPGSGSDVVSVAVVNRAPVVNAGASFTAVKNSLVTLTGSATDPDGDAVTLTWSYTDPVAGFDAATDPNSFSDLNGANEGKARFMAPNVVANQPLTFVLTAVDTQGATSTGSAVVTVIPGATGGSSTGTEQVAQVTPLIDVTTDLGAYTPGTDLPVSAAYTVTVRHDNGVDNNIDGVTPAEKNVNNTKVIGLLQGPTSLSATLAFDPTPVDSKADPSDLFNTVRTFTYTLAFPAKLDAGTYSFSVFYDTDGDGVRDAGETIGDADSFVVNNVAPTIAFGGSDALVATELINTIAGASGTTSVSLDDQNWDSIGAAIDVHELASLTFSNVPSGLSVQGDSGSGFVPLGTTVSLATENAGPLAYSLKLAYAGGDLNVLETRTFTIVGNVTDQHGAFATLDLFTVTLQPSNFGFSIVADDTANGSPGIALSSAAPGQTATSNADPFAVTVTGTQDAASLTLDVPTFTSGAAVLDMNGATVKVYSGTVGGTPLLSATVTGNQAVLDFQAANALGAVASGQTVLITLEKAILGGQQAGSYSGTLTVSGTALA